MSTPIRFPMNESKLLTTGQRQVERGKFRAAADTYAKLLVEDPEHVQALLLLADVYVRMEDEDGAIDAFGRAAESYGRQGDLLKALAVQQQAVDLLPRVPAAQAGLGHLCLEQGREGEAMEAFSRAMDCFADRGDRLGALRLLHDILKVAPDDLSAWLRLAEGFSALGHVKEASDALRVVALQLHAAGQEAGFRLVAERLLYHDASDSAVARRLARSYLSDGLVQQALPALRVACRAAPRDLELLGVLRDALVSLGQEARAVVVLKTMARLYADAGLPTERDDCYDQILVLTPDDESVRQAMDPPGTLKEMPTIVLEHGRSQVRPPTLTQTQEVAFETADQGTGEPLTAQVIAVEPIDEAAPLTAQVIAVEQIGEEALLTAQVIAVEPTGEEAPVTAQVVSVEQIGLHRPETIVDPEGEPEVSGRVTTPVVEVWDAPDPSHPGPQATNAGSLARIMAEGAAPNPSAGQDIDALVASVASAGGELRDMDALFAVTHAVLDHQVAPQAALVPVVEVEEGVHEVLARELEELDFYIAQGLDDEAGVLVAELKERYGEHPAVQRRTSLMQDPGTR